MVFIFHFLAVPEVKKAFFIQWRNRTILYHNRIFFQMQEYKIAKDFNFLNFGIHFTTALGYHAEETFKNYVSSHQHETNNNR